MKKNWFFLVTSLVCIIVSMFALTFAWYIGGNAKVEGKLTGFEAVSPEDIAIDIENSQAVEYPFNGTDGLIPCSPIGAGIDAISSEEWFIPSFLPSERGRRCCYAFDITVYSSAGFTGTKRIAVTFDPRAVNVEDKEKAKEQENSTRGPNDQLPYLTQSQINAKQAASNALVSHIQCAAILLKGNEIGVNQLIAHTDYSIYDEESDYYIRAGRQMEDFYYEFNRHEANIDLDKLNQKIRVLVWIDGFVPDYSTIAGGEALIAISIQDKTPGTSDAGVDPTAAVDAFMDMYNAAKNKPVNITTRLEFRAVVDAYRALSDKAKELIGKDEETAEAGEALRQDVNNNILDWTNKLRHYDNVLAFMREYNEVKESYTGVTIQNHTSIATVINDYNTLLSEDGQEEILVGGEIEGGEGVAAQIETWRTHLQAFETNLAAVNAFLSTHYEPNKDKVVNQANQVALQNAVNAYDALKIDQKGLVNAEVTSKINEWKAALSELEANITVVNNFKTNYYDPIVSDYGTVEIGEVQGDLTRFNTLKTEYDKLTQAQIDLLQSAVKTNIQDWQVKIVDVTAYNAFKVDYDELLSLNGTGLKEEHRSAIQDFVNKYDIKIAAVPQRLGLVSEEIQNQIKDWKQALRGTELNVVWNRSDITSGLTWIKSPAPADETKSEAITNPANQKLKEESGVTITAIADKTSADYKSSTDANELNRIARDFGINYMVKANAYNANNTSWQDFLKIDLPTNFSGTVTITASPFMSMSGTRLIALKLRNESGAEETIESPKDGNGYYIVNSKDDTAARQYEFVFTVRTGGTYYLSNVDHSKTVATQKDKSTVYISSISVNSATDNVSTFRNVVDAIRTTTIPADTQTAITRARTLYTSMSDSEQAQVGPALETLESWENAIGAIVAIGNIGNIDEITKDNYLTKETLVTTARTAYNNVAEANKIRVYNIQTLTDAETKINGFKATDADVAQAKIETFLAEMAKLDKDTAYISETNCNDAELFTAVRNAYYDIPETYRTDTRVQSAVQGTYAVKRQLAEDIRNFIKAVNEDIGSTITLESKTAIETAEGLYAKFVTAEDKARVTETKAKLDEARTTYNNLTANAFKIAVDELVKYKDDPTQWSTLLINAYNAYEAVVEKNTEQVVANKATLNDYKEVYAFLTVYNDAKAQTATDADRLEAVQAYYCLDNDASKILVELSDHATIKQNIDTWNGNIQVDVNNINIAWTAQAKEIEETKDTDGKVTSAKAKTWFDNDTFVTLEKDKMAFNAKNADGSIVTTKNTADVITSTDYTLTQSGSPVRIVAVGGRTYADVDFENRGANLARYVKSYSAYKAGDVTTERALNFIKITIPNGFKGNVVIKAAPYNTPTQGDRKRTITLRLSDNGAYEEEIASTGSPSVEHPFTYTFPVNTLIRASAGYTTYYLSNIWNTTNGEKALATVFIKEIAVISEGLVQPTEHTVTFDSKGGSNVASQKVAHGETIAQLPEPTREGFTFDGWFTQAEGGEQLTTTTAINADVTYYAQWTEKTPATTKYIVTFNPKGGKFNDNNDKTAEVNAGETVRRPPDPILAGYTLEGWYTHDKYDPSTKFDFETDTITANITLYAKWVQNTATEYTVTFDLNYEGASNAPADRTTVDSKLASLPDNPSREGYTFDGWFDAETGGNEVTTDTAITDNMTVYAHWTAIKYTVTFVTHADDVTVNNEQVAHGSSIELPTLTRNGYTFDGWYNNAEYTGNAITVVDPVTSNLTFHAKWTAVTPNTEVTLWDYTSVGDNKTWQETGNTTSTGIELTPTAGVQGFKVTAVSGTSVDPDNHDQSVKKMVKVNATTSGAIEISVPKGFNGEIIINAAPFSKNTSIGLALNVDSNTDNLQTHQSADVGITTDGNGGTHPFKFAVNTTGATTNTTYYLSTKGTKNVYITKIAYKGTISGGTVEPTKHTVTVNKNDGSQNIVSEVEDGGTFNVPADPTRDGYRFDGWFDNAECTGTPLTGEITVNANITLYAKWTQKFTVTFNSNGGSAVESQTVVDGGTATEPATAPTRTGYRFDGWYADEACENAFNFTTTITTNTTIYAKWTQLHTVTFKDDNSTVTTKTVAHGETIADIPIKSKTGYTFDGWFTETGDVKLETTTHINADVTYVARWTAEKYTVTYYDDEKVVKTETDIAYGTQYTLYALSDKEGYTFTGWLLNNEGNTYEGGKPYEITSNTTFYAKWTKNRYTVTFNMDGGSGVPTQTINHGEKATRPTPDPTKTGYTFDGWYKNSALTETFDFNIAITSDTNIYAKWTKGSGTTTEPVTVKFSFEKNLRPDGAAENAPDGWESTVLMTYASGATNQGWKTSSNIAATKEASFTTTATYENITSIKFACASPGGAGIVFSIYVGDTLIDTLTKTSGGGFKTYQYTVENCEKLVGAKGNIIIVAKAETNRAAAIDNVEITYTPAA